jgi:ferredoxin
VAEKCASCGRCVEACPVDAVKLHGKDGKVSFDYDRCIRCYCCQELCPHRRIELKSPAAARLLGLDR